MFDRAALAEFREATRYSAVRLPQLGDDFVAKVRRATALIALRPDAGARMAHARRRWLSHRFPYAVVYRVASDGSVRVLAVAHH